MADGDSGEAVKPPARVFAEKLISSMKTTAAARFNAARRLEGRSRSINFMLAMLSSSVIVTSVLPFVAVLENWLEVLVFLVGLAASTFVVVLSLYQWSSRADVNAEKLHQAGMKISELRRQARLHLVELDSEDDTITQLDGWLEPIVEKYSEILRECGINHEDSDYVRVKVEDIRNSNGNWSFDFNLWLYSYFGRLHSLAIISFVVFLGVLSVIGISVFHVIAHPEKHFVESSQARRPSS